MRQIYLLLLSIIILISFHSTAQLNYLFSATTKSYVPVTGGITPHLVTDYVGWEVEDEGFARVPIGFEFKYDGENYTKANINVNGFITLKDSLNIAFNYPYFLNGLGSRPLYNKRPVIAPFWDDLLLTDTLNLVYKTTGRAPFRVFTVEWKKIKWVYESVAPVISIQLRLYETTNAIEFHYKDEGTLPDARFAFASIGITSSYANRDFISLQNTSSRPTISMLKAMDSLTVKPANNQVYRFVPSLVKISRTLRSSLRYTNNHASFSLIPGGFKTYEYALSKSPIAPNSGIKTFSPEVHITSLSPATTYYIYARSTFFGYFHSQWECDSFTTAVNPVEQPYHITGNATAGEPLPSAGSIIPYDMRRQNFTDTNYSFSTGYNGWSVITDFPHAGDTTLWALNFDSYDADEWIFTPGIKLLAGKKYEVKFGYLSYYLYNVGDPASIEVKYGKSTGAAAMKNTLFAKTDIRTFEPYDEFGGLPVTDTVIEISPERTDTYYFGFHNLSLLTDGVAMIVNFSVTEKAGWKSPLVALKGTTHESDNLLNWSISGNSHEVSFEVERSTNGINFTKIGTGTPDAQRANRKVGSPILRINKDSNKLHLAASDKESSKKLAEKYFEKNHPHIVVQKNNAHNPLKPGKKFDFKDRNAKGINYYRLQQMDKNGKVSYSNIVKLDIKDGQQLQVTGIYPNPVRDKLNVNMSSISIGKRNVLVTDLSGRILINKTIQLSKGQNNFQVAVNSLPAGTYLLKIVCSDGCENKVKKFIKE